MELSSICYDFNKFGRTPQAGWGDVFFISRLKIAITIRNRAGIVRPVFLRCLEIFFDLRPVRTNGNPKIRICARQFVNKSRLVIQTYQYCVQCPGPAVRHFMLQPPYCRYGPGPDPFPECVPRQESPPVPQSLSHIRPVPARMGIKIYQGGFHPKGEIPHTN